jgi:hypothetical protein
VRFYFNGTTSVLMSRRGSCSFCLRHSVYSIGEPRFVRVFILRHLVFVVARHRSCFCLRSGIVVGSGFYLCLLRHSVRSGGEVQFVPLCLLWLTFWSRCETRVVPVFVGTHSSLVARLISCYFVFVGTRSGLVTRRGTYLFVFFDTRSGAMAMRGSTLLDIFDTRSGLVEMGSCLFVFFGTWFVIVFRFFSFCLRHSVLS